MSVAALAAGCAVKTEPVAQAAKSDSAQGIGAPGIAETRKIAQEAYVYAFPMIAGYKAMYQYNIDKSSSQYKAPFNKLNNEARVFTYKDTAIVTPNSDTPYSMVMLDLRAEPMVMCVPAVDKKRYYSVQLADMYTHNVGYIGSRATGSAAGCFMVTGPSWKGATPAGIRKVFPSETQFMLAIYRTQLFDAADMPNVKKVQAGYKVEPLSAFLKQTPPPAAPDIQFPAWNEDALKTGFASYLDFLMKFTPEVPVEKDMRARFASIGIGPGKKFDFSQLDEEHKAAVGQGIKDGFEQIDKMSKSVGQNVNGWMVGSAQGNRAFYNGNYVLRAAAAKVGIYGNDAVEATYPVALNDNRGQALDGSKSNYTITFAADQLPPVNSFWSVTMYDGKTQLLIENPINRYLINSPMLRQMKKNADGSVTMYLQHESPGKAKEANWLPAPNGPIYAAMRLYWPKETPPSVLPAGSGTWKPPMIVATAKPA
ncbi:DUF1254 domain-containing protein [Variovorax sp. M-6]|uniref:DUF1254 domain-containing protein n=1 Tax=Variovorax sp. M-6 TaxID=3233041 RepID=UPI003F9C2F98